MQSERQQKVELMRAITDTTVRSRIGYWVKNLVHNEEAIKNGKKIESLRKRLKDMPCIIIGSGPSLDKNKKLLKAAKGKAFIICVDTALEVIKDIVIPDAVIALEAQHDLIDLIDFSITKDIMLFVETTATPKIVENWLGEVLWFTTGFSGSDALNEVIEKDFNNGEPIGRILPGGCVVNAGFAVAKEILECDPIILVGADCSFSNIEKTHSDGVHKNIPVSNHRIIPDEDIYGNIIFTTEVFQTYKNWIEGVVRTINPVTKRPDCEGIFINATEGGVIKNGWLLLTLQTVITTYLPNKYNFEDTLNLNKKLIKKPVTVNMSRTTNFGSKGIKEEITLEDNNDRKSVA